MDTLPPVSLHTRILAEIEQRILSGQWPPGFRIPSEIELSERFQCSRMTVNKVLTQLARAGLIERQRKAGSFVTRPHSISAVLDIQDIRSEVLATGQPYRIELLSRRRRTSTRADRAALQLTQPEPVLHLLCLHHAGARPFCLEDRIISLAAVPAAADARFDEAGPGAWLVHHVPWSSAEHRIRAMAATPEVAARLHLHEAAACLAIERRTWSGEQPITHVRLIYPADGHELVARFSPSSTSPEDT